MQPKAANDFAQPARYQLNWVYTPINLYLPSTPTHWGRRLDAIFPGYCPFLTTRPKKKKNCSNKKNTYPLIKGVQGAYQFVTTTRYQGSLSLGALASSSRASSSSTKCSTQPFISAFSGLLFSVCQPS